MASSLGIHRTFTMLRVPPYEGSQLASTFDAVAQAFFDKQTALGQTLSATEKSAVNTLVTDLKASGVWATMTASPSAIYPMVGGTVTSCCVNLSDPNSFLATATGTPTASSNGIIGGGAYLDTGFNPTTQLPVSSLSFGVYLRTDSDAFVIEIGADDGSRSLAIFAKYSSGTSSFLNPDFASVNATVTDSLGLFASARVGGDTSGYKRGTQIANATGTGPGAYTNSNFALLSGAGGGLPSSRQVAFAFICAGLSQSEVASLYTAVQAFQATLGRNV